MFGWLKKKQTETDPKIVADRVRAIVADFGEFLEKDPDPVGIAIQDEQKLPHNKETILTALLLALCAQDLPATQRVALVDCAMYLAYFQKGVGVHPLHQLGVDLTKFDISKMSGENLVELMSSNPAGKERYDRFFARVQADIARIGTRIHEANRLWPANKNSSDQPS